MPPAVFCAPQISSTIIGRDFSNVRKLSEQLNCNFKYMYWNLNEINAMIVDDISVQINFQLNCVVRLLFIYFQSFSNYNAFNQSVVSFWYSTYCFNFTGFLFHQSWPRHSTKEAYEAAEHYTGKAEILGIVFTFTNFYFRKPLSARSSVN